MWQDLHSRRTHHPTAGDRDQGEPPGHPHREKGAAAVRTYPMVRRASIAVSWDDFAATVETGDIALFSGQSMISTVIKLAELWSNWSHIGMFVREASGAIRIWESTNADGQIDLISDTAKGGVRLVDAETAIRAYLKSGEGAMVVARRLYIDKAVVDQIDPVARLPALSTFMQQVAKLPYEQNPLELMRASDLGRWMNLVYAWRTNSSFFCSELVACSYIKLGLLPDVDGKINPIPGRQRLSASNNEEDESSWYTTLGFTRSASNYTPTDFAEESQNLPFLYDPDTNESMVALGPHLEIVFPDLMAGSDPSHTAPKRMPDPVRPRLRLTPQQW